MAKKRKRNAKAARSRKGSSRRASSRKKKRHKVVTWWIKPKGKLSKREKHLRAQARARSYSKRARKRNNAKKRWFEKDAVILGLSRERAERLWDGKENLNEDQVITLLQRR